MRHLTKFQDDASESRGLWRHFILPATKDILLIKVKIVSISTEKKWQRNFIQEMIQAKFKLQGKHNYKWIQRLHLNGIVTINSPI